MNMKNKSKTDSVEKQTKKQSQMHEIFVQLRKNKGAMVGMIVLILLILMAVTAPLFYDYEEDIIKLNIPNRLQKPSLEHFFGTDEMGRDLFARVVWGARASLSIGFAAVALGLIVGGFLGAIAGFYGSKIDMVIMRIIDIIQALPPPLLAITIIAAFGSSVINLVIALAIAAIPGFSRVIRGSVFTVRNSEYVEAIRAVGAKSGRVIFGHVIPNSLAPVIVYATLAVAGNILMTAGLSFVGLGIQAPTPEWGSLLAYGRTYIRQSSYLCIFPGVAIMITILALNLFGDGLRDALDPKLK